VRRFQGERDSFPSKALQYDPTPTRPLPAGGFFIASTLVFRTFAMPFALRLPWLFDFPSRRIVFTIHVEPAPPPPAPPPSTAAAERDRALIRASLRTRLAPHLLRDVGGE
jgi:hypothetical protein